MHLHLERWHAADSYILYYRSLPRLQSIWASACGWNSVFPDKLIFQNNPALDLSFRHITLSVQTMLSIP